jgi:phosphonate transport system ATP-binding protein
MLFLAPQVPPLPSRQRVVTAILAARLPSMDFVRALLSLFYPLDLASARAALTAFGLEARIFDRIDRLSGGERQRVGLARAMVSPARLWLLDEPLAALDPVHASKVLEVLCAEARRRGVTLVVSLHHADLARAHFSRLVGLRAGRVAFDRAAGALTSRDWNALYAGEAGPRGGVAVQEGP